MTDEPRNSSTSTNDKPANDENKTSTLTDPVNDGKRPTVVLIEKSTSQNRETIYSIDAKARKETFEAFGERHEWGRPIDSVFAMVSFAVATSNISRFISSYYEHGGMCFLIPYLLFTAICGFPLLYMECVIGQFFREGFISIWKVVPVLKGIGYSIGMVLLVTTFYYMTPIVWCIVYLYYCFSDPLPWATCNNEWNTPDCIEMIPENFYDSNKERKKPQAHAHSAGSEYFRGRILQIYKSFYTDPPEGSLQQDQPIWNNRTEIDRFGFDTNLNIGDLRTELALTLALVYFCTYVFLLLDIKWTGWLTRFTASLPFAVLSILFFRGVVLDGAVEGLSLFFTFDYKALLRPRTWLAAASETFYSLGSGFGSHLVIASHNHFHHNVFRDCCITVVVNLAISLFGAWTLSEYLGHWANLKNSNLTYLISKNEIPPPNELIFVVFPDAVSRLAGGAIFIFLFLFMMVLIIFDTMLIAHKSLIVSLADEFRHWFTTPAVGVKVFTFALAGVVFVVNLLSVTRGGLWVFDFLENYSIGQSVFFVIFVQVFAVAWIWGMAELCEASEAIFKKKPGVFVRICWKFLVPLCLLTLFVLGSMQLPSITIDRKVLPRHFVILGNALQYLPILPIPIYAITQCCQRPEGQTRKDRMRVLLTPQYVYHKHPQVDGLTGKTLTLKHFVSFGPFKFEKVSLFNRNTSKVKPEGIDEPPPTPKKTSLAATNDTSANNQLNPNDSTLPDIHPTTGPTTVPPQTTLEYESSSNPNRDSITSDPDNPSLPHKKKHKTKKVSSEMVQSKNRDNKATLSKKKKTSGDRDPHIIMSRPNSI